MKKFLKTMSGLKNNRRAMYWLIAIDLALAISSTVVDWPWLIRVPQTLVAFAPICSLYPWLLVIWHCLYLWKKKVAPWFTSFLFLGLFSYGFLAWIYFPLYMNWNGINFHDIGSILWVTLYAGQAFIVASELKKIPTYQFIAVLAYFFFKDYADRYLGTFLDFLLDTYPSYLKIIFFSSALSFHAIGAGLLLYIPRRSKVMELKPENISGTLETDIR